MLRVISDIHLELEGSKTVDITPAIDDVMVLAGDIGIPWDPSYSEFITRCSVAYKQVIVIAGNHEYYTKNPEFKRLSLQQHINNVESQIKNICDQFSNVVFLQRSTLVLDDVLYLGCTLWSIPDPKYEHQMNDMYLIPGMNSDAFYRLHQNDKQWLSKTVRDIGWEYSKVVVITHHLPSKEMIHPDFQNHHLNCFFASDCPNILQYADVAIAGHSHRHVDVNISIGTHICRGIVNPVGYQHEVTGFIPDFTA